MGTPSGCRAERPRSHDPHRGRNGAARQEKEYDNGDHRHLHQERKRHGFTGAVKTLTLNVKAKFVPTPRPTTRPSDKAPDFRIFSGADRVRRRLEEDEPAETGRDYLSVKLDDPSFPAPIYASLVEAEDGSGQNLIWSRRNGD